MDVGHFWAFQADESSLEKQRHLTAEINKRALKPLTASLYPNQLCLAPYSETCEQSFYYRAKILHLRGSTVEVNVFMNVKCLTCQIVNGFKPVIYHTDYRQLLKSMQLKKTDCSVNLCFAGFLHRLWQHSSCCMQQPERAAS